MNILDKSWNCDRPIIYAPKKIIVRGLGVVKPQNAPKKVIVRGLGVLKPQRQLDNLIEWLSTIHKALPELELV